MKKQQSHKDIASDSFYCRENLKDINCRKIHYHTENIHAGSSCRFHKQDTLQGDKNFHIFHPPGHLPYKIGIILHQCILNTDQNIANNPEYHFPSGIDRIHTGNPENIPLHTDRNRLHISGIPTPTSTLSTDTGSEDKHHFIHPQNNLQSNSPRIKIDPHSQSLRNIPTSKINNAHHPNKTNNAMDKSRISFQMDTEAAGTQPHKLMKEWDNNYLCRLYSYLRLPNTNHKIENNAGIFFIKLMYRFPLGTIARSYVFSG